MSEVELFLGLLIVYVEAVEAVEGVGADEGVAEGDVLLPSIGRNGFYRLDWQSSGKRKGVQTERLDYHFNL